MRDELACIGERKIVFFSEILARFNRSTIMTERAFVDTQTWIISAEARAAFFIIAPVFLEHHVILPYSKAVDHIALNRFSQEQTQGNVLVFITNGMNYYFSDIGDAMLFKLTFG